MSGAWVAVGVLSLGALAGAMLSPLADAQAEVQSPGTHEPVPNITTLTLPVLNDIAATLHRIDARLEHLEAVAKQWPVEGGSPPPVISRP